MDAGSTGGGWVGALVGVPAALLMAVLRRVRGPRPIHTTGLLLDGTVRWAAPTAAKAGIAWIDERGAGGSSEVVARLSRGAALPASLPDVLGLAVRFGTLQGEADLLVSSSGFGFPGRFVLHPRWTPARARFSTVMPYRGEHGPVLVAARSRRPLALPAAMERIAAVLHREPWLVDLYFASPRGRWHRFAELDLVPAAVRDTAAVRFDAVLHPLPGAGTYAWTRTLREPGYAEARRSRSVRPGRLRR